MLQPGYRGTVEISTNEHDEVVVRVNERTFIADLMFMNRFAVCVCGDIQQWEYFFSQPFPLDEMEDLTG